MIALQNLNKTTNALEITQLRITTGLKINGPKDDAPTFAIAQNMRGDIGGIQAVKAALATGESTANVAISAGKAIADLLIEMKAKVVQANQSGLDSASRTALHNDFVSLREQFSTIVASAEFNGVNLITQSASNLTVLSTVDGSVITVSAQSMDSTTLAINTNVLNTSSGAAATLTSINTAIMIDLTGQVVFDSIGRKMQAGPGGQLEFVIGAVYADGGRSIHALPSMAREQSRIVAELPPGANVGIPRYLTDIVVTEHGVASMFGKSERARAEELIAIAHPDQRPELREQANRVGLL